MSVAFYVTYSDKPPWARSHFSSLRPPKCERTASHNLLFLLGNHRGNPCKSAQILLQYPMLLRGSLGDSQECQAASVLRLYSYDLLICHSDSRQGAS